MNYLGESKIGLTQKTIKTAVFMSKTAVLCVMREQFRYTLEIGKNESWSGFELFQLYFFAIDCPSLRIIGSFLRVTKIDTALPT